MAPSSSKRDGPARRETSIRRGIDVLMSLASDEALGSDGLGVTQIAELLGREKSQVSRALTTLGEYGLVERNADATYRLGWRLHTIGKLAGRQRLLEVAAPALRDVALRLGERAHISVLQGSEVVTVLSESPGRVVQAIGWVGRVTPVYCTSAGRALLIDAGATEIERVLANVTLVKHAPRTPRSARAVAARVVAAREAGYAVADQEFEPDLIGVAVPVRDPDGSIVAALNVSAPRFRFLAQVDEAAKELITVSRRISTQIDAQAQDEASANHPEATP